MFVRWAVLFIGLVAAVRSEGCTEGKLNKCKVYLDDEETGNVEERFPTKEYLDRNCGPSLSVLKCGIDFNDRCPGVMLAEEAKIIRPVFDLVTSICDNSSVITKGYLDNVECYNNNTNTDVAYVCGMNTVGFVYAFQAEMENRTDFPTDMELEICIGVPYWTNCIAEAVSQRCGEEEASPLNQILNRISDIVEENLCSEENIAVWAEEFAAFLERLRSRKII